LDKNPNIKEFLCNKPPLTGGQEAIMKVFATVLEDNDSIMRLHANECLKQYLEAVLYAVTVKMLEEGEVVPPERVAGGMDVLKRMLWIVQHLELQTSPE
jgi:hypothetical protein